MIEQLDINIFVDGAYNDYALDGVPPKMFRFIQNDKMYLVDVYPGGNKVGYIVRLENYK
jgi:hypothetical protein